MITADDLEEGRKYRWSYRSATGINCSVTAKYRGMSIRYGIIWLNWDMGGYDSPFEYNNHQRYEEILD